MLPLAFISYSAADRPTAQAIAAGLKLRGVPYFLDVEHGLPGDSIFGMVNTQLEQASHFLFVASTNSLTAAWPQGECGAAFGRAMQRQLMIIPCLLGIQAKDLPPLLADRIAVDLSDIPAALDRIAAVVPGGHAARVDLAPIQRAFGTASQVLLGWPQETGGRWLERPKLDQLLALASEAEPKVVALLGPPGAGKSALLARLGNRLAKEGVLLLALKADQLPRDMETLDALDRWVGVPVVDTLRGLAAERRVVLLIDQLDALSELMDQQSQRLSAMLRLVGAVAGTPNLQVIVSSREFEYRNDVRLSTLKAEAVTLPPLPWEQVERFLVDRSLDPSGWSPEVREVLRLPQHLALFLTHLAGQGRPGFTSYHGLLEDVLAKVAGDCGPRTIEAAEYIAATMGEEEELSLGVARFRKDWNTELRALDAAGLIIHPEGPAKLSFSHQTLADYLRARAFLRDDRSLADFVRDRQESLFVRPTLWTALAFLRTNSPATYRRQFAALWDQPGLRPHLRFLLITFLGQLADPDQQEAAWLLPLLDDTDRLRRRKALYAMAGSPGWFEWLTGRLPTRMAGPPDEAWETVAVLSKAVRFAGDAVLDLIERCWAPRPETQLHALIVLEESAHWTPRAIALAGRLAAAAGDGEVHYRVVRVIERISREQPDQALQVLRRYLDARFAAVKAKDTGRSRRDLLGDETNWYGLDKIALRAPQEFVRATWDWLVAALEGYASLGDPILNSYRMDHSLLFPAGQYNRQGLPEAVVAAIIAFAEQDPNRYADFVAAGSPSDLMAVHHLLSLGLERIAATRPDAVLDYLLGDPRRLAIGEAGFANNSERLIAAVVPALSAEDALRLEQSIIGWPLYREMPSEDDANMRRQRREWTRRHRLLLLRAFPTDRLSAKGRRHFSQEERAFPNTPNVSPDDVDGGWVGSPMSADQMAEAADDDIIGLFHGLVDSTEWSHPTRQRTFEGGSIQASREFARFASQHPDRALRIIQRFQPGLQERPAGYALEDLAKAAEVAPQTLVACVHALDARGFASPEFRSAAARCLEAVARRAKGLDAATCNLLKIWLTDWTPPPPAPAELEPLVPDTAAKEERADSLLWSQDAIGLPGGNFPILDALRLGLLLRDPPDPDAWLDVLEQHLERPENPEVWAALAMHLHDLGHADHERAAAFLGRLFVRYPIVLQTGTGVALVARIHGWLPDDLRERVLAHWLDGSWPRGPQAVGEIVTLRLCHRPEDAAGLRRVEALIDGSGLPADQAARTRLGVTHVLVHAWREPDLRPLATSLLLRVLPLADSAVAATWVSVLTQPDTVPAEPATKQLLEALLQRRDALAGHLMRLLVDNLQALLRAMWEPELICRVASALVGEVGGALGDVRTAWAANASDLTEIALTLHRLPQTRQGGLDLFERLLAVDAFELDQRLGTLDRRPFA